MDPTKPILTLQGPSSGCFYRDTSSTKPPSHLTFQDKYQQIQYQRNFFKDQYQRLYQAYQQLKSKIQSYQHLKSYISQLESKIQTLEHRTSSGNDFQEMRVLKERNEQLSETILNKNYELEDAYRKIQENSRRVMGGSGVGGMNRKVLGCLDKLEDGVKEAVFSNFELLKNTAIGELRGIIKGQGRTVISSVMEGKMGYASTNVNSNVSGGYTVNEPIVRRTVSPQGHYQSEVVSRY